MWQPPRLSSYNNASLKPPTCCVHKPSTLADLKAGFFVRRLAMAPRDSSSISSAPAAAAALAPGFEVQECPEGSYQPYEGEDPVYNCTSCGVGLKTDGTGATSSEACCEWPWQ